MIASPESDTSPNTTGTTGRIAAAALLAALGCCLFYALDRTYDAIWNPGPDPAQVMAPAHIGYFWRLITCAYLAPIFAAAGYWGAAGREVLVLQWATRSIVPVVGVCSLMSMVWP